MMMLLMLIMLMYDDDDGDDDDDDDGDGYDYDTIMMMVMVMVMVMVMMMVLVIVIGTLSFANRVFMNAFLDPCDNNDNIERSMVYIERVLIILKEGWSINRENEKVYST